MIDFIIINYWWLLIVALAGGAVGGLAVRHFIELSKEEQILSVKEWLIYAVAYAEKELGSGTGALKLRMVYDMFLTKFPHLSKFITFNQFSNVVDVALERFKAMLAQNKSVQNFIKEDKDNG